MIILICTLPRLRLQPALSVSLYVARDVLTVVRRVLLIFVYSNLALELGKGRHSTRVITIALMLPTCGLCQDHRLLGLVLFRSRRDYLCPVETVSGAIHDSLAVRQDIELGSIIVLVV